ncbi:MAG: hypothetical protein FJ316_05700 [SAR202 cluster bacterium]|nr:hypothetical protein [SAR202 cluster bacterium]
MGKFLDLLDRIANGAPAALGFGVARAEKVPVMALIPVISRNHADGLKAVATLAPEAVLLSGLAGAPALKSLTTPKIPWGVLADGLTGESAAAYQEGGCDVLAFSMENTQATAVESEDVARVLCLSPDLEDRELRIIDSLPADVLLLDLTGASSPMTLRDLGRIATISRRASKHVLVQLSQVPGDKELAVLRDVGVRGLVLDLSAASSEQLAQLKAALLALPRKRPDRKGKTSAILPGSVHGGEAGHAHGPEHEEEEEEDDDGP